MLDIIYRFYFIIFSFIDFFIVFSISTSLEHVVLSGLAYAQPIGSLHSMDSNPRSSLEGQVLESGSTSISNGRKNKPRCIKHKGKEAKLVFSRDIKINDVMDFADKAVVGRDRDQRFGVNTLK